MIINEWLDCNLQAQYSLSDKTTKSTRKSIKFAFISDEVLNQILQTCLLSRCFSSKKFGLIFKQKLIGKLKNILCTDGHNISKYVPCRLVFLDAEICSISIQLQY